MGDPPGMAHDAVTSKASVKRAVITRRGNGSIKSPAELRTHYKSIKGVATVLIGPVEIGRCVSKEVLTAISPFFRAALDGNFAEGVEQIVRLPEERIEVFDYFLFWLYTRTLDHEAVDAEDPVKPAFFHLLHLYTLADKLGVESCKNSILNKMVERAEATNSVPTPTDTWIIFETYDCVPSNPMRRLIVDLFAWKRTDNLVDQHEDEWHPRFMRDLCVRLKRSFPRQRDQDHDKPWAKDICQYHEHLNTRPCRL